MRNQKIKIRTLLIIATLLTTLSFKANAATAPDIAYRSGTASPYSSAKVEYTTAGTYSWTVPTNVTQIKVTTIGGGGGGGGANTNGIYVYGGGGGAVTENVTINVTAGKSLTAVVGKGGSTYNNNYTSQSAYLGGNSYVMYNGTTYAVANGGRVTVSKGTAALGGTATSGLASAKGGNGAMMGPLDGSSTIISQTAGKYGSGGAPDGGGGSWGAGNNSWGGGGIGGGGRGGTSNSDGMTNIPSSGNAGAVFISYTDTILVTGISVSPTTAALNPGGTTQLAATVSPSNATNRSYSWSSNNTGVATVNASGLITAVANGTATITATTADGGHKATCTVTVATPTSGVSLVPTTATIIKGMTQQLTATVAPASASNKSVTWTSSNNNVATVSASGLVTGVTDGTATITATTASGGYKATCAITVRVPVSGISVSSTNTTLIKGRTQQLSATVSPADATNKSYTWSSTNNAVAAVSESGLVTAVGGGSATISATTADGSFSAGCAVTVTVPVTGIDIADVSVTVNTGSTAQLAYTLTPADATNKTVTWTSGNTAVATVNSATGVISPVAPGGTEITATTADGGFTDKCFVMVTNNLKPLKIKINTEGGKFPGFATVYYKSTGSLITYPGCAVDGSGNVSCSVPVSSGNCKLGVSLLNSLISGIVVDKDAADITADPLKIIEGDLNSDNVINGTDYTLLTTRINYSGGETTYGKVGDINYDGSVNRLDMIIFNSPISFSGENRYLTSGYDMTTGLASTTQAQDPPAKSIIKITAVQNSKYEVSFSKDTPACNMFQLALEGKVDSFSYSLPDGFQLIGQKIKDGMTMLAIGTPQKDGLSIPASKAIIAFEAPSMPVVKYGDSYTTMQLGTADGIKTLSFDIDSSDTDTQHADKGRSSGCNATAGAGGIALLLIITPSIFLLPRRKK